MKTTNYNESAPKGRLLAMDTSTSSMTVAILADGRLLKEINSQAERNHSMYLLPNVQEALRELGLAPRDLDGIAVGRGPGSYTGVRIGITVAKTMAWALKLPVFGVSSLEAMAAGALAAWEEKSGIPLTDVSAVRLVPLMNARRGQVYTGLYVLSSRFAEAGANPLYPVGSSGWSTQAEDAIRPMDRWVDELLRSNAEETSLDPGRAVTVFAGETEGFEPQLERFQGAAAGLTAVLPHRLRAYYIGLLGYRHRLAGERINPHQLLPNYTQLAEAEAKLLRKTQPSSG